MYSHRILSDIEVTPNDYYRELEQAFISSQYDNTTVLHCIQEQDVINNQEDYYQNFTFSKVQAWVTTVVGQTTSTGSKTGRDFLRLIFEDINHPKLEGRYYLINNEYYLSYFDNRLVDVDANLSVRRCNQWMKIVDPLTGAIYQTPAIVDYDMSAPSNRVSNDIITPNNHAVVKVQQNAMTDRLFVTNARFILGGRAFKITGMQNAINQFINNNLTSLMEIDLFLDEIWEEDNLFDGVAYNGDYNYQIETPFGSVELIQGATGQNQAFVLLNGEEVTRVIDWASSNEEVITVDETGQYLVTGSVGERAEIYITLHGNTDVFKTITVLIVDEQTIYPEIVLDPLFTFIREGETININVSVLYNGNLITPQNVGLNISGDTAGGLTYTINGNVITLTCLHRYNNMVSLLFSASSTNPSYNINKLIRIKLTSLLG